MYDPRNINPSITRYEKCVPKRPTVLQQQKLIETALGAGHVPYSMPDKSRSPYHHLKDIIDDRANNNPYKQVKYFTNDRYNPEVIQAKKKKIKTKAEFNAMMTSPIGDKVKADLHLDEVRLGVQQNLKDAKSHPWVSYRSELESQFIERPGGTIPVDELKKIENGRLLLNRPSTPSTCSADSIEKEHQKGHFLKHPHCRVTIDEDVHQPTKNATRQREAQSRREARDIAQMSKVDTKAVGGPFSVNSFLSTDGCYKHSLTSAQKAAISQKQTLRDSLIKKNALYDSSYQQQQFCLSDEPVVGPVDFTNCLRKGPSLVDMRRKRGIHQHHPFVSTESLLQSAHEAHKREHSATNRLNLQNAIVVNKGATATSRPQSASSNLRTTQKRSVTEGSSLVGSSYRPATASGINTPFQVITCKCCGKNKIDGEYVNDASEKSSCVFSLVGDNGQFDNASNCSCSSVGGKLNAMVLKERVRRSLDAPYAIDRPFEITEEEGNRIYDRLNGCEIQSNAEKRQIHSSANNKKVVKEVEWGAENPEIPTSIPASFGLSTGEVRVVRSERARIGDEKFLTNAIANERENVVHYERGSIASQENLRKDMLSKAGFKKIDSKKPAGMAGDFSHTVKTVNKQNDPFSRHPHGHDLNMADTVHVLTDANDVDDDGALCTSLRCTVQTKRPQTSLTTLGEVRHRNVNLKTNENTEYAYDGHFKDVNERAAYKAVSSCLSHGRNRAATHACTNGNCAVKSGSNCECVITNESMRAISSREDHSDKVRSKKCINKDHKDQHSGSRPNPAVAIVDQMELHATKTQDEATKNLAARRAEGKDTLGERPWTRRHARPKSATANCGHVIGRSRLGGPLDDGLSEVSVSVVSNGSNNSLHRRVTDFEPSSRVEDRHNLSSPCRDCRVDARRNLENTKRSRSFENMHKLKSNAESFSDINQQISIPNEEQVTTILNQEAKVMDQIQELVAGGQPVDHPLVRALNVKLSSLISQRQRIASAPLAPPAPKLRTYIDADNTFETMEQRKLKEALQAAQKQPLTGKNHSLLSAKRPASVPAKTAEEKINHVKDQLKESTMRTLEKNGVEFKAAPFKNSIAIPHQTMVELKKDEQPPPNENGTKYNHFSFAYEYQYPKSKLLLPQKDGSNKYVTDWAKVWSGRVPCIPSSYSAEASRIATHINKLESLATETRQVLKKSGRRSHQLAAREGPTIDTIQGVDVNDLMPQNVVIRGAERIRRRTP